MRLATDTNLYQAASSKTLNWVCKASVSINYLRSPSNIEFKLEIYLVELSKMSQIDTRLNKRKLNFLKMDQSLFRLMMVNSIC